jgi:glycosyltransferase involved in cell wall biosynthesis
MELSRGLSSIKTQYSDDIEIIISEDCSPRKQEIESIVLSFIKETPYKTIFNSNKENLGFDRNLRKLIDLANGEYLLFLTDDDAIMEGKLDELIKLIPSLDFSVGFTPYYDCISNTYERKFKTTTQIVSGMDSVAKYLYSSILLSGLIFKKSKIPNYDAELFKDLIYSQVYLFASVLRKNKGCYIDIPIIQYIGDGENSFGKNDASVKNELLADRKNFLSNLEFHKNLIKTINFFDIDYNENLIEEFSKEYSLKSYTGMFYARSFGRDALLSYWQKMNSLDIQLSIVSYIYFAILFLLGCRVANMVISIPRFLILKFRKII